MDAAQTDVANLLARAKWLPPGSDCGDTGGAAGGDLPDTDWLEWIRREWSDGETTGASGRSRDAMLQWLHAWRQCGARLTLDFPEPVHAGLRDWLGPRLFWWPRGVPSLRRIAVVSSRIGRRWDRCSSWFASLRRVCEQLDPSVAMLLSSDGAAASPFVIRAAQLFGLPRLRIKTPSSTDDAVDWLRKIRRVNASGDDLKTSFELWLSPPLLESVAGLATCPAGVPLRDRLLASLSDEMFVLSVRKGGNVENLTRAVLRLPEAQRPSVTIIADEQCVPTLLQSEFAQSGAELMAVLPQSTVAASRPGGIAHAEPRAVILDSLPGDIDAYLTHWTREARGAWPGQSEDEYLDALLRGDPDVDRSALAALRHIVGDEMIRGGSSTIRGATPVVCFTEVPPGGWSARRVFRPHRGTWDYESYGISIRRSLLEQFGARPVYYGSDQDWEKLSDAERPFFQLRFTRRTSAARIDWSDEREWRLPGTLDLRRVPSNQAVLFVPSRDEALILSETSKWPIVVISQRHGGATDVS
jgi:hypothetical protein